MEEINRFRQKVKNASNRRSPDMRLNLSEASCLINEIDQLLSELTTLQESINTISEIVPENKQPITVNVSGEKF